MAKSTSPEEWKKVPDYKIYEASTYGRIRSTGPIKRKNHKKDNVLNQLVRRGGYLEVKLSLNGKARTRLVHQVILQTFLGKAYGKHVNHKDGNKKNNKLSNLEWVTEAENKKHAAALGLMEHSENRWNASFTNSEVVKIRELYDSGWRQARLAEKFGATTSRISLIVNRKIWKHV